MATVRRGERGAAAVEAALVLCFLVIPLIFAIITYAYILAFRQSLSQAADEGVRAAAVAPAGTDLEQAAIGAVNAAMQAHGLTCGDDGGLSCSATPSGCSDDSGDVSVGDVSGDDASGDDASGGDTSGGCYTVDVSYDYNAHPLLPKFGLGIVLPNRLSYSATAEVN